MIAEAGFSEGAMYELGDSGLLDVAEVDFVGLWGGVFMRLPLLIQ
ncbi:hypothetical protein NIES21_59810 (plasmid) [Anabaenopsis circularis NIES-21]|uniref:Uncharacterized protein n=1 Tax=Anabaenopsis circularis NIES-21 TaxID=1085406 RepID=A0A1Z4GRG0_9CYAN|nr:hypothetical protein NIES21_59810 [Anabaenopsis circularis NIES-21]